MLTKGCIEILQNQPRTIMNGTLRWNITLFTRHKIMPNEGDEMHEKPFFFCSEAGARANSMDFNKGQSPKEPHNGQLQIGGSQRTSERGFSFMWGEREREREKDFPCIIVDGNPFMFEIYARVKSGMHQTLNA